MIYTWYNCSSFTFEKNLAFPTGSKGVEVPTIIHWSTTLPNLPDAQDNKQHDVKRLNHGSLMLIIFSFRGRFDNFWCHLLHTSENTFKMIYTWYNCSSFTFEKNLAFPTGSKGVEVPTIIHWSTTLPNLPDAQDNKQHDVKRLNHGSLMLIIFSFRGRFNSFGR